MDAVLLDPELAPQVVKLLNDTLQDTRKALDASKRENETYQNEINHLRNGADLEAANRRDQEDRRVQDLERGIAAAQEENQRLQAENADLRGIIDGYRSPPSAYKQLSDDEAVEPECTGESCPARRAADDLEREVDNLSAQLHARDEMCANLQKQASDLEDKLRALEASDREQQGRLDELRKLLESRQTSFDEREAQLRQQLDTVSYKYGMCKNKVHELMETQANAQAPNSAPSKPQVQQQEWYEVVNYVLSRPCFPLSTPSAPLHLPANIKSLMGNAILTSYPNRLIYPFTEGFARLIAPKARCLGAHDPLEFGPPTHELARMVGTTRELFYHSYDGICYAGTFVATAVGDVERSVYASFEKPYREAIIRHTFHSKGEFMKTEKVELDRLRNKYIHGNAKVEYLELRYIGFNKPFFNAIMGLGLMNEPQSESTSGAKRLASASEENPATKRARGSEP